MFNFQFRQRGFARRIFVFQSHAHFQTSVADFDSPGLGIHCQQFKRAFGATGLEREHHGRLGRFLYLQDRPLERRNHGQPDDFDFYGEIFAGGTDGMAGVAARNAKRFF